VKILPDFLPANGLGMLMLLSIITIALLLLDPTGAKAQIADGGYAESYMLRDVGARAISMGGAYTAVSNEPMGIFYNPAGLSTLGAQPKFSTMYSFLDFARTHSALAYGQTIMDNFSIGAGLNTFTTGSFDARDARGNSLGNFTDWQMDFCAGASYSMEFVAVGASAKYLSHTLSGSGTRADGFALDIGALFNVMDIFSYGISVQNITGMMFWNTDSKESDLLPFTIRTGAAMEFALNESTQKTRSTVTGEEENVYVAPTRYVLVSLDGTLTQFENSPTFTVGVEAAPHEVIAFRAGLALAGDKLGKFEILPMTQWGFGISIKPTIDNLPFKTIFDYSISNDRLANNGIAHHLSLGFEF
jgi:hypothetical protein